MSDTKSKAQSTQYKHEDFQEELPVELQDSEVLDIAGRLGEALTKFEETQDREKEAAADYKHQLEQIAGEIRRLNNLIKQGYELRPVNCLRTIDYETRTVTEKRVDTGEVIRTRACKPSELQTEMGLRVVENDGEGDT